LSGFDQLDATSSDKKLPNLESLKRLKGLRIGLPKQYFLPQMEKEVGKAIGVAIKVFEKLGAKIFRVNLLNPKYSVAVYTIIQRSEVSSNLARFDGIRYGKDRSYFGDEAKRRIMLGTYTLSAGYYDAYYKKAQKVRSLIVKDFQKVFEKIDVLLAPTSPSVALPIGSTKEAAMFGELQDILVEASSLAGLPAINIPCGFGRNNLPVGMQVIAPQFREDLVLQTADAYQQLTDWHVRKPLVCSS
jgi:aspartyl-tRNA(Asn)/glutamyl-tRNA(Gln) amidotransferase subunit A